MYACWPDPRGGGISSVTHDLVLSLHELDWDVILAYPARVLTDEETENAVYVTGIEADNEFQWREATDRAKRYESFADLVEQDPRELSLHRVNIVHSHFDTIIPRRNPDEWGRNSYATLLDHIERASGTRPKLVRTRHDDLQGGLDRLMRLTGVDFLAIDPMERASLLGPDADLRSIVEQHVRSRRDRLVAQGFSHSMLDDAIEHVWFVVSQLELWKAEQEDADAIVSLYEGGTRLLRAFHPEGKRNLTHIYNGTSMVRRDQHRINQLLHGYHVDVGLSCFVGAAGNESVVSFLPSDQKIIFVGRDDPSKGLTELVRAFVHVRGERADRRIRLIIVGHFSPERRREVCTLVPESVRESLLFTGWVDDAEVLLSLLAFGNVTAVPSHYDPFNLVACESFLAGTPCVITESIGAAEVYLTQPQKHGVEIGLAVQKPCDRGIDRFYGVDCDSLAIQLGRLLDDEDLAYRLGRAGHEFVSRHYNHRVMGQRYVDLYSWILAAEDSDSIAVGQSS